MFFSASSAGVVYGNVARGIMKVYRIPYLGAFVKFIFIFCGGGGRERIRLCGMARDRPSPYGERGGFFP